jgi:drug/metabolite transporter (DMT)-like permease
MPVGQASERLSFFCLTKWTVSGGKNTENWVVSARKDPIFGLQSRQKQGPYLALALGVLCIGTSAIFVKIAGVPGTVSAFYRVLFAGMALLPLRLSRNKLGFPAWKDLRLIGLGSLAFAGDLVLWNTSILLTSAAAATLLANNSPVWVGLGATLLFKEKLSWRYWAGLVVALTGMAVIVGGNAIQELRFNLGDLLAIGASFLYAAYMLITQKARAKTDTLSLNLITMLACIIILLPVILLLKQPLAGFSSQTWLALAGLGLVPQFIGWLAINYAMGHVPAARVSVTLLGQSVITAILGIVFLHEALSLADIAGGLMVLAGIYLVNQRAQTRAKLDAYTKFA